MIDFDENKDYTLKELNEIIKSMTNYLKADIARLDRESKERDKRKKELEEKLERERKEREAELERERKERIKADKKIDDRLDRIAKLVGAIGNSQGEVAEEFFVNSLKNVLRIGKINFDYLLENVHLQTKKVNDEFDILLVNGSSVALIEVKYKVHPNVIDSLDKKIEHLKLMKEYKNYKIYAGVAGFKVPEDVIIKAKEKGYFVLKREGKVIHEYVDNLIPA